MTLFLEIQALRNCFYINQHLKIDLEKTAEMSKIYYKVLFK